jgi:hypothetical protein
MSMKINEAGKPQGVFGNTSTPLEYISPFWLVNPRHQRKYLSAKFVGRTER